MQKRLLNCVILAAGKGTRMVSKIPKIAHAVMGRPMVSHVVATARRLGAERIIVVTGHERETIENILKDEAVLFAVQAEQKGTAHALLSAEALLGQGDILVLYGDVPLIQASTLDAFADSFERSAGIVFITTKVDRPEGYGRVIVGEGDEIEGIVEDSEADDTIKRINVINTGICMIRRDLLSLVKAVRPNNRKGEYYLTDVCAVASARGLKVRSHPYHDAGEVLGVNTRRELQEVNLIMRNRILDRHMEAGVTIADRTAYIEDDVSIGADSTILPYTYIAGRTDIGEGVTIGPFARISNSVIGRNAVVESFVSLSDATIAAGERVVSFSQMRGTADQQRIERINDR